MKKVRRLIGALSATLLALGVLASTSGPAQAAHVQCGDVITTSVTLDSDVGPCPGDGLVVRGSNITIDLGGHRVFAANGSGDNAGIRLANVTGVTVVNGTVEGFDAGIAIMGGSGNTVRDVTARNNINDGQGPPCDLGDGIAVLDSDNNRLESNDVIHNGPFGGISLIGDSDGNQMRGNRALDNNVVGVPRSGCGNLRQDEGIRIEGPGANNNRAEANLVQRSLLAGIGLHGHVCSDEFGDEIEEPNAGNSVVGNDVSQTAGSTQASDGISVLAQGPLGTVTCAATQNTFVGNRSVDNARDGIFVAATSTGNTINTNRVDANARDGIRLSGPVTACRSEQLGPPTLDLVQPDRPPYVEGVDYLVEECSGAGDVTAELQAIDVVMPPGPADTSTSGCEASDFQGFTAGNVALIQRGTCTFEQKVDNAEAAGASAVIIYNEGQPGRTAAFNGSLPDAHTVPVLFASFEVGQELYQLDQAGTVIIHVVVNKETGEDQVAPGAENNLLMSNRGQANVEHDGHDDNANCDNNKWRASHFVTVNQPCVVGPGGSGEAPGRTGGPGRSEDAGPNLELDGRGRGGAGARATG